MITFGKRKTKIFKTGTNPTVDVVRGYYLCLPSGDRHWFSSKVNISALEKICAKYLTDTQFNYSVEYCYGYDVNGNLAWSNLDHTDEFF